MEKLDEIDKKILREMQGNLPIVKRPFLEAAKKIGICEEEFFSRVKKLIEAGIIRKFGLRIDSKKAGFASTLVAMKVPKEKLEEIAEQLNSYESITHNYARDHEYNLWFTVIERDEEALKKTLERIGREVEHEEMLNLPVLRRFKIDVKFEIK
ncbi:MAG: AsnC family transcriptional regulator [Candidatus Hydrothermarchaeota archaeon]|nr:AsnC family transcriptional regulator [Candidatus Hydrothermarchaeota archaeon]